MNKILENHYRNGINLFCRVIIRVFGSWCNNFARLRVFKGWCNVFGRVATRLTNGKAIDRIIGKINYKTADKTIDRGAGGAIARVIGRAAGKAINKAVARVTRKIDCKAAGEATSGVISEAVNRIWTYITIIFTNLLAYMRKLFLFISNFYLMAISFCCVILAFVDLLTLQLYCKTISSIGTRKKKVVEQAIFLLISLFHLFLIFIKSYLVSIAITVAVVASCLAFC